MDDLELDEGVITDEEVVIPPAELRVPEHWRSKMMSTRKLTEASPLPAEETLAITAAMLEARVTEAASDSDAAAGSTLPAFVWERLVAQEQGSIKAAQSILASLYAGIEACHQTHAAVQLFAELCGMLTDEHSEIVCRRVLGLLAPDVTPPLLGGDSTIAKALMLSDASDDADGAASVDAAVAALPRLRLAPDATEELDAAVRAHAAGPSVRLAKVMLASVASMRKHVADSPADVVEEEEELQSAMLAASQKASDDDAAAAAAPADDAEAAYDDDEDFEKGDEKGDDDDEEEEMAEEVVDDDDDDGGGAAPPPHTQQAAAPAASSAAEPVWAKYAAVLNIEAGAVGAARREELFDSLDADSDGQLALEELETALPRAIATLALPAHEPKNAPLLREAIARAFEAAKDLGASLVVRDSTLSRDAFDRVVAYLHATCMCFSLLHVPLVASELDELDEAAVDETLVGGLPHLVGGLNLSACYAEVEREHGVYDGSVPAELAVHAISKAAAAQLMGEGAARSPSNDFTDLPPSNYDDQPTPLPPAPLGGLDTVLETTERSAFSATADWGQHGSEPGGGTSSPEGGRGGTLGGGESLASVKKGFWPASAGDLDVSLDEEEESPRAREEEAGLAASGSMGGKYEAMMREHEASKAEVAALKAQLERARTDDETQRELHRQNVNKMLRANEDLQQQLKELNGVVERVVQVSLGGPPPKPPAKADKLPASAFPQAAKPGSKKSAAPKKK